ncbi:hypothetical protein Lade_0240 [Legionella adelaidensis]|uniref:ATPase n=1 Tax=Legionella adelaidensis TaxID=45056 RepID=A0A0W0R3I0_9GAMM|nr:AAA family ATPase [Legionella adelaidensis]KTC65582.1 hypothetical protein Lade_0240 [Legionella adelaidensis]
MERKILQDLTKWVSSGKRKPLILRGARQVGKTWIVRHLAKINKLQLIELNFEKNPSYSSLFSSNPKETLLNLSVALNKEINPGKALLFLDEIQAAPEIFANLRWFAEELPELPVIAAGSLLEFLLADHNFSMPVGRVGYMYIEPFSFEEFLLAKGEAQLFDYLKQYTLPLSIPDIIHEKLISLVKEYIIIGGLPAVISTWIKENSLLRVQEEQNDLLTTYREDFNKYKGRIETERLDEVLMAVPRMLGQKFVYRRASEAGSATAKQVINLLEKARLCHRVQSSAANGTPLEAEVNEKHFKEIFLDTGLCSTALGLNLNTLNRIGEISLVNNGGIAEQLVGQLLRTINPPFINPSLYYWQREKSGSSAEIDYVMQYANQIIPIEVKAGAAGSMKSLHLFMGLKKPPLAIRFNSNHPLLRPVDLKDVIGNKVNYPLLSLPFYLIGQLNRLIEERLH